MTSVSEFCTHYCVVEYGPGCKKTCLLRFANNKCAEQAAHSRSLISAFGVQVLDSITYKLAINEISIV